MSSTGLPSLARSATADVGAILAAARRVKGMSQRQLATRLGVSQGCVAYWEQGRRELTVTKLYLVSRVLGIHPAALLPTFNGRHVHGLWQVAVSPDSGDPVMLACGMCSHDWTVTGPT